VKDILDNLTNSILEFIRGDSLLIIGFI